MESVADRRAELRRAAKKGAGFWCWLCGGRHRADALWEMPDGVWQVECAGVASFVEYQGSVGPLGVRWSGAPISQNERIA